MVYSKQRSLAQKKDDIWSRKSTGSMEQMRTGKTKNVDKFLIMAILAILSIILCNMAFPNDVMFLQRDNISGAPTVEIPAGSVIQTSTQVTEDNGSVSATCLSTSKARNKERDKRFIVHIMGSVNKPGSYEFTEEPMLIEAVLRAGSAIDNAALSHVRLIRGDPENGDGILHVDLDEFLETGNRSHLPRLYSGDIIYIPDIAQERTVDTSTVIIAGQVLSPGAYRIRGSVDILDAILLAGGLTESADTERIRLRRETADSYEEKIVNVSEVLSNIELASPSEMIEPGYRIFVPARRSFTSVLPTVARGLVLFLADLAMIYSFWRIVEN